MVLGTASSRGSTTEARDGAKLDGLSHQWRHQLESATKRASGAWVDAIVRRLAHSRIVVKNRWGELRACGMAMFSVLGHCDRPQVQIKCSSMHLDLKQPSGGGGSQRPLPNSRTTSARAVVS